MYSHVCVAGHTTSALLHAICCLDLDSLESSGWCICGPDGRRVRSPPAIYVMLCSASSSCCALPHSASLGAVWLCWPFRLQCQCSEGRRLSRSHSFRSALGVCRVGAMNTKSIQQRCCPDKNLGTGPLSCDTCVMFGLHIPAPYYTYKYTSSYPGAVSLRQSLCAHQLFCASKACIVPLPSCFVVPSATLLCLCHQFSCAVSVCRQSCFVLRFLLHVQPQSLCTCVVFDVSISGTGCQAAMHTPSWMHSHCSSLCSDSLMFCKRSDTPCACVLLCRMQL